jgi:hypothetical protein
MMKKIGIVRLDSRKSKEEASIGALVVLDILERSGKNVGWCDFKSAFNYDMVLVSMTSTDDVYQVYSNCFKNGWDKRGFISIVGGFGCVNPLPLSDFIDYAFFGRCDDVLPDFLENISDSHDFVMNLKHPKICAVRQTDKLYPHPVIYDGCEWRETSIGCPVKCKFCHYSHNRKWVSGQQETFEWLIKKRTIECLVKDIPDKITEKQGWVKSAIDGYSERLRLAYGKKFATWQTIEKAIDHLIQFKGSAKLHLYNIHNLPTETESDRQEFRDFFTRYCKENQKPDGRFLIEIHNTPFRPTINTPLERAPVVLFPAAKPENMGFSKNRDLFEDIEHPLIIASGKGISVQWTKYIENPFKHLCDVVAIRNVRKDIIHDIAVNLKSGSGKEKLEYLFAKYDLNDYLREYGKEENLPWKWVK